MEKRILAKIAKSRADSTFELNRYLNKLIGLQQNRPESISDFSAVQLLKIAEVKH
jgi:hypothetical protein